MVRRLELARAMLHEPIVLFLDEPTIGLDPIAREAVWRHVADLRDRLGTTIVHDDPLHGRGGLALRPRRRSCTAAGSRPSASPPSSGPRSARTPPSRTSSVGPPAPTWNQEAASVRSLERVARPAAWAEPLAPAGLRSSSHRRRRGRGFGAAQAPARPHRARYARRPAAPVAGRLRSGPREDARHLDGRPALSRLPRPWRPCPERAVRGDLLWHGHIRERDLGVLHSYLVSPASPSVPDHRQGAVGWCPPRGLPRAGRAGTGTPGRGR